MGNAGKGETGTSRVKSAAVYADQRMLFGCRGTGVDHQFVHQPISLMLVNCIFSAGKYLRPHVEAIFFPSLLDFQGGTGRNLM